MHERSRGKINSGRRKLQKRRDKSDLSTVTSTVNGCCSCSLFTHQSVGAGVSVVLDGSLVPLGFRPPHRAEHGQQRRAHYSSRPHVAKETEEPVTDRAHALPPPVLQVSVMRCRRVHQSLEQKSAPPL